MDEQQGKKSLNDERYRIPGTNMFNFSRWKRENEPPDPPKYKVGDVVVLTTTTVITRVYTDCDGTPLYALDNGGNGHEESALRPATDDEAREAGRL